TEIRVRRESLAASRPSTSAAPSGSPPSAVADRKATVLSGNWKIDGDELVQDELARRVSRIVFGDPAWSSYDLKFKAKSTGGTQGFGATLHFERAGAHYQFNLGSYGNKGHELSYEYDKKWGRAAGMYRPGSIEFERWYDVKVEVRNSEFRCFLDGKRLFDHIDDRFKAGLIGFATWDAVARFRDIEVTTPEGQLIGKGLPVLPVRPDHVVNATDAGASPPRTAAEHRPGPTTTGAVESATPGARKTRSGGRATAGETITNSIGMKLVL